MLVTASPVTTWPASRRISTLRLKIISQLEASAVGSLHRGIICSFAFLCRAETEAHGCAEVSAAFDLLVHVTTDVNLWNFRLLCFNKRLAARQSRGRRTGKTYLSKTRL